jgi:hypothetical protein
MISCSRLLIRPIANKIIRSQYLSSTASHNNTFGNSVKDALKAGEKYGTLSVAVLAVLGAVAGVSTTLKANDEKLKASIEMTNEKLKTNDEKLASLEKLNKDLINEKLKANNEKIKANNEKIASLEKLMDEKINSSVQKSVHVALENFLKYSYSNEYEDMRVKHAKQSIVSKDNDISIDISDDSKTKTKD